MRIQFKTCAPILFAGCVAICLSYVGSQYLLKAALEREARLIGMDWARHIEKRLSSISGIGQPSKGTALTILPEAETLRALVSDVFEIGHMYQFDFINVICRCHVSLNSANPDAGPEVDPHAHHDHPEAPNINDDEHQRLTGTKPESQAVGSLPSGLWKHVVNGKKPHPNPKSNPGNEHQYPVDRDLVTRILDRRAHHIIIRQNVDPSLPSTFAEVYHSVTNGTEVQYLMRVVVNLEEQARHYRQFMLIAVAISILILGVAVGYPTRKYVLAARHQRKANKRVEFLANHDVLTNLYNRNNFQESVSDIIWSCHEKRQSALLFVFDLNDFKEVNDCHGHLVGDRILCEFASLLRKSVPKDGYIARLGGDEFVVVIGGIDDADFDYRDFLEMPDSFSIQVHGGKQTVSANIAGGVVRYPRDAETTEELIQLADLALYAAKPNRSGEICEYVPEMKEEFFDRLKIRGEFREALNASQIEPYYQPIVNMKTGVVESFEALARWNHPEKGLLTPFVFAVVFEDGELCAQLGQQMFSKMVDDMSFWQSSSVPFRKVSLNVTDGDLKSSSFAKDILDGLEARGLLPSNLTIEVTENCLFGPGKMDSIAHLETLRDAGCSIALDDFGTGYSSITQLKELPITTIKIDKSFIDDVLENEDDQSIIGAMLELGKSMSFGLVMEGIETSRQLALLKLMGSELAQGYYFSRPMPAAEVPAYIERQNSSYDPHVARVKAG